GFINIVNQLIIANADKNAFNNEDLSPLFLAIKSARIDIFQTLLNSGADPTIKNKLNYDVILFASYYGEREMMVYLLDHLRKQKK
ncbi:MAG: ankyrin repeat domain-containing protein, partial [Nanoarchaeota archaeon]